MKASGARAYGQVSLRGAVEEVVELFRGVAAAKGVVLSQFVAGGVPSQVVGDPGRLRQVLTNLVGNAIKFTDEGCISVRVVHKGGTCMRFRCLTMVQA